MLTVEAAEWTDDAGTKTPVTTVIAVIRATY
jgi:hypothetical protein